MIISSDFHIEFPASSSYNEITVFRLFGEGNVFKQDGGKKHEEDY